MRTLFKRSSLTGTTLNCNLQVNFKKKLLNVVLHNIHKISKCLFVLEAKLILFKLTIHRVTSEVPGNSMMAAWTGRLLGTNHFIDCIASQPHRLNMKLTYLSFRHEKNYSFIKLNCNILCMTPRPK